jgi:hypothetical protein
VEITAMVDVSNIKCFSGTNGHLSSSGFAGMMTHEFGHVIDTRLHDFPMNTLHKTTIFD